MELQFTTAFRFIVPPNEHAHMVFVLTLTESNNHSDSSHFSALTREDEIVVEGKDVIVIVSYD